MKKIIFLCMVLTCPFAFSQGGMWTWMNGDSIPGSPGNFGVQGVPSPGNHPPGLYEACEWTDPQGNFWLYGGQFYNGGSFRQSALWKFEPSTNMWTWMWGDTIPNQSTVFGVKGVASPAVSPGTIYFGACTFIDSAGNLWLFGGEHSGLGQSNSLWKFDIGTNMWTWMSGSNTSNSHGHFGIQGVPSPLNEPGSTEECTSSWFANNCFWYFGGINYSILSMNNLWKYDLVTDEWTWMRGDSTPLSSPVYGVKGVSNLTNDPGSRTSYSHWKDLNNNLWFFGGVKYLSPFYADMWKYDIGTNEWTWMNGSDVPNDSGYYGTYCNFDSSAYPCSRMEHKACWTDNCGMFWLMGGRLNNNYMSDLWQYNPNINQWKLVNGNSTFNLSGNFGTKGVMSISNSCPSRVGASPWLDNSGNLWIYGGYTAGFTISASDMWRYTPDTTCSPCNVFQANFTVSDPTLCPGGCISFSNTSINATSYLWNFPGAIPNISTDQNPNNICYNQPGLYDVTLIVSNSTTSDTLILPNYILVHPYPSPQSITLSGDTLFALQGAQDYQWYFNGSIITGATNYFYVALTSGNYNVIATDTNGCEVEAVINDVIAGLNSVVSTKEGVKIYPTPVSEKLNIYIDDTKLMAEETSACAYIYNSIGELVLLSPELLFENAHFEIDVHLLPEGIYFLELGFRESFHRIRFIKQ